MYLNEHAYLNSKIKMSQHNDYEDWWEANDIYLPLFKSNIDIMFMDFNPENDSSFIKDADDSLSNILGLKPKYLNKISKYVYKHFNDFCLMVDANSIPNKMKNIKKNEIWNFVEPDTIFVERRLRRGDNSIYLSLACGCDWEEEHGLSLVFKLGKKLTRVSDQDGWLTDADAKGIPDTEDKLLSEF